MKQEFTTIHLMYTLENIRMLGSDIPQRQSEERHSYQPANRFLSFSKFKKKSFCLWFRVSLPLTWKMRLPSLRQC